MPIHRQDGEEYQRFAGDLIAYGEKLFTARWPMCRPQTSSTYAPSGGAGESVGPVPVNFTQSGSTSYSDGRLQFTYT